MAETARQSAEVQALLTVRKSVVVGCPDCSGVLTFGDLMDHPLAWHSQPWCAAFERLPSTATAVVDLFHKVSSP